MISASNLDLQSLRIFALAAHTCSLTLTAERVHMTLSAVSRRITELEQQVGHALFERHPRGLTLTTAGQEMLKHAREIVGDVERLVRTMDEFSRGVRGRIRIWANTSAVIQYLPNDLYAYRTLHPSVRIELEERLSSETIRALQAGEIDIGIVAENTPAVGLEKRHYRNDQLVLIVPHNHALAHQPTVSFEQIVEQDLVGTNHDSAILRQLTAVAAAQGYTLRINVQASSFEAILSMVNAGHGISVLPRAAVARSLPGWNLTMVNISDEWAKRRLWIVFRKNEKLGADATKLVDHLANKDFL